MEITKDFFLKNLKSAIMYSKTFDDPRIAIFNQYKIDNGAEETEVLICVTNKEDFKLLVDNYGISTAVDCYMEGKTTFFLIGSNYDEPKNVKNLDNMFDGLWGDIAETILKYPANYMKYINFQSFFQELYNALK